MEWNDPRPLKSWPGDALATELADLKTGARYGVVMSALESLATLGTPYPEDRPEHVDHVLVVYLRGVAAAAIVADTACNTRHWTSAQDFALHGGQVDFLPPDAVLLGTLSLAMTAIGRAVDVFPAWEAHPGVAVPFGHGVTVGMIQQALGTATQARMTQVTDRAEDVNGA